MVSEDVELIKRKTLSYTKNVIIYFFIYAFIGWVIEVFFVWYKVGILEKRGFLFGPICPIYGYGALMLILTLKPHTHNKIKLFFSAVILFSTFEYIVGFALEAFFKMTLWNYSGDLFNLNGRISLYISIIWGLLSLLIIYYIHPFIKKHLQSLENKLSYSLMNIIFYILCGVYIVDTLASIFRYTILI